MPNQESKPSQAPVQNSPANKKTASDRTKKKSKHSEKSADDTSPLISAVQSRTAENEEASITHYTEKRSKEEKELQQLEPSENTSKSSKKRKRKDIENSKANEDDENIVANEPKRKKRNRTEFADPRADESLGSQCRKGEHTIHDEPN